MSIYLTGSTGFIGKNLLSYFKNRYPISVYTRNSEIDIHEEIVIHLAGLAHDLKNVSFHDEYYKVNTELTKKVFDAFLNSNAKVFVFLSSVKAVVDEDILNLKEDYVANPQTHYGKSKLLAEQYILSKEISVDKRVYILRPCMIHGPGNKGNLNLLYKFISFGFPWPLGKFENNRSYLSIENLLFVINELIVAKSIPSGIYNIADEVPLSTNEIVRLISESNGERTFVFNFNRNFIRSIAFMGSLLNIRFNSEMLKKLTANYVVDVSKILSVLTTNLPVSASNGLLNTFNSFKKNKF
jgi:nucleoside-diphosphate-sugar epimerase